jgi:RluA family pseudouridine synthase
LKILFEDDVLIAVDKPPGLPTQPTVDRLRPNLIDAVKRHLAPDGGAYLGVHQLLDRDTSGVILFAKAREANAGLAAAFAGRIARKTYLALTARPSVPKPDCWRAAGLLAPAPGKPPRMRLVRKGGVRAEAEFEIKRRLRGALLVEARPRTGRKHQIRVQLAAEGMPVLGDVVYGGPSRVGGVRVGRSLLHAAGLRLPHPTTGAPLVLKSPLPPDFSAVLQALAARTRTRRR